MPKLKKQSQIQRQKNKIKRFHVYGQNETVKVKNLTSAPLQNISEETESNILQTYIKKVIVGDFSQFYDEFPLPHHQCTAIFSKINSFLEFD